jgi:Rieske [2Fe-2S] domain
MSKLSDLRHRAVKAWPFQTLPTLDWSAQGPTYRQADPGVIRAAVARAQCRPSGNWFALAACSQIATKAWGTTVDGVEIVAWRGADGALRVAPRACPHLGADLATAAVECATLVCPWHGLRLSDQSRGAWQPVPAHDDVCCAGFASTPSAKRSPPTLRSSRPAHRVRDWPR